MPSLLASSWLYIVHDGATTLTDASQPPGCLQEVAETMEKQNLKEESIEFYNQAS